MSQKREGCDLLGVLGWSTNDGYGFRHHDLVCTMGVQVPTAHKTRLRRMRVNPSNHHQPVVRIDVVKEGRLVDHLTSIA